MNVLKKNIQTLLASQTVIITAIIFSYSALQLRVILNKSMFYTFLVWNVFLAFIPYLITMYLNISSKISKLKLLVFGVIWLLFLPNAPYIITDFVHLKNSNSYMWWLDILVLLSFALTGLYLFYKSLNQMEMLIKNTFCVKKTALYLIRLVLFLLCGFGIYLGRYLRFNSWEILSRPEGILSSIIDILFHPLQYK